MKEYFSAKQVRDAEEENINGTGSWFVLERSEADQLKYMGTPIGWNQTPLTFTNEEDAQDYMGYLEGENASMVESEPVLFKPCRYCVAYLCGGVFLVALPHLKRHTDDNPLPYVGTRI